MSRKPRMHFGKRWSLRTTPRTKKQKKLLTTVWPRWKDETRTSKDGHSPALSLQGSLLLSHSLYEECMFRLMLINYERLGIHFLTYFQFGHTCCERTYSESVSQYQARNAIPEDGNSIKECGENQRIKRSFIFTVPPFSRMSLEEGVFPSEVERNKEFRNLDKHSVWASFETWRACSWVLQDG